MQRNTLNGLMNHDEKFLVLRLLKAFGFTCHFFPIPFRRPSWLFSISKNARGAYVDGTNGVKWIITVEIFGTMELKNALKAIGIANEVGNVTFPNATGYNTAALVVRNVSFFSAWLPSKWANLPSFRYGKSPLSSPEKKRGEFTFGATGLVIQLPWSPSGVWPFLLQR